MRNGAVCGGGRPKCEHRSVQRRAVRKGGKGDYLRTFLVELAPRAAWGILLIGPKHKGAPPTEPFEEIMERAQAALAGGDVALAERLFGNATVVKPASAAAWLGKGRAFTAQGAWDKALRCFSIAVKFDPKNADAFAGRAEAWHHSGERAKAVADLDEAAALEPAHRELERLRALVR